MSKILIVDDDEMMIMLARRILATKYEVVTATSGAEAIEMRVNLNQKSCGTEFYRDLREIWQSE